MFLAKTYGSLCQFNLPNRCPSFSAPHKALKSSSPAILHWTLVALGPKIVVLNISPHKLRLGLIQLSWGEITHKSSPLCCGSPPLWDHSEALRLELRFVQSHRWSPPSMQLPCYWFEDLPFLWCFCWYNWKENPHKYLDISSSKENGVGLFDRTRFMRASN